MICFGDVGRCVVGKTVQQILRTNRSSDGLPPDIAGVVSLKFTFDIALTQQSYYRSEKQYQVNSVVVSHGRECATPITTPRASAAPSVASQVATMGAGETAIVAVAQGSGQPAPAAPIELANDATSKDMKTPPPPSETINTPVQKTEARATLPNGKHPSARKRLCP
ncbi:hypothetical protein BS78_04G225000 [Paspalum vaginatum]|nr:hypothetical protein BS78_04G225000 [Paspalum vaginatum]